MNKPPHHKARHKVWKKRLVDSTRQLRLGDDRARQKTELEMLAGTEVSSVVTGECQGLEKSLWQECVCGWKQLQDRPQRQVTTQPLLLRAWMMNKCGRSGSQWTGLEALGQVEGQGWQWLLQ